jgi:hypothetical protein
MIWISKGRNPMSNVTPIQESKGLTDQNHRALRLLADGLTQDFVEYLENSEEYVELLHTKVIDFIAEAVPFTNEEAQYDLGFLLMDRVGLKGYNL